MEKEHNQNTEENTSLDEDADKIETTDGNQTSDINANLDQPKEKNSEEKIFELEDKLARTFAEMENQRRRFEKEKDEAYEYGGFTFAKEALGLIDNLERSKQILENDESLKKTDAQKKNLRTLKYN